MKERLSALTFVHSSRNGKPHTPAEVLNATKASAHSPFQRSFGPKKQENIWVGLGDHDLDGCRRIVRANCSNFCRGDEIDDLENEVWAQVLKGWAARMKSIPLKPFAWLKVTTRHAAQRCRKRDRRRCEIEQLAAQREPDSACAASSDTVERLAETESYLIRSLWLRDELQLLDARERDAVQSRFGLSDAPTVAERAREWKCTSERVLQLARDAIRKLRRHSIRGGVE